MAYFYLGFLLGVPLGILLASLCLRIGRAASRPAKSVTPPLNPT